MNHKVRIAPSPTGRLHIGTIRTAYHNYLVSKQTEDSVFQVRIDDTDLERSREELIKPIFDTLEKLGLDYDETFKQSERFPIYLQIAKSLVDKGLAKEDDGCIRLEENSLSDFTCDWKDEITGNKPSNDQIDSYAKSQVIIKSDGSPAYNFASIVDDYLTGVTWIIRGVDHISNTYKQVLILKLLWEIGIKDEKTLPLFSHVGLVCHKSGKKLSKRDSDEIDVTSVDADALLNYVLRLGWSPKEDNKSNNIIDKDKAIRLFLDEGNIKSSNAKIDLNKLDWYDKKYKRIKTLL